MTCRIYPTWDFAQLGVAGMDVTDNDAGGTVTFSSGIYAHLAMSAVGGLSAVSAFAGILQTALNAMPSARTYTVTFSESTLGYTITPNAGTVKLDFAAQSDTILQYILGSQSSVTSTTAAYVSDAAVYYAIDGAVGAQTDVAEYEAPDVADVSEADDGSTSMVARTTAPVYYDAVIPYEAKASVYSHSAVAATPWTWQHFFAHIRTGNRAFAIKDSGTAETTVHQLRKDGTSFAPDYVTADRAYQAHFHIPLKTTLLGRL